MVADDPARDSDHLATETPVPERKPWQTPRFERHDARNATLANKVNQFQNETTTTVGPVS